MCHSVELYLPKAACRDAEHRLGQVDFTAACRERRAVGWVQRVLARLRRAPAEPVPEKADA